MKVNWNFQRGVGGEGVLEKKIHFCGGGIAIFWKVLHNVDLDSISLFQFLWTVIV